PPVRRGPRRSGAGGSGWGRTDPIFCDGGRMVARRAMIRAEDPAGRGGALARTLPMQRDDFIELFRIMRGLPVTIRLLDPPLHEFLPNTTAEMDEVAKAAGVDTETVRHRAAMLKESNPMLGHRGCRLGITFPEIYEMQVRAIFEAAAAVHKETDETAEPEVMIPLVAWSREFAMLKELVDRVAEEVADATGSKTPYLVGTMIELPRAALRAEDIPEPAESFTFATNDLTQPTSGISRDDAGRFLTAYERAGILTQDPFVSLDVAGVGELVQMAAERGRRRRPRLKLGI